MKYKNKYIKGIKSRYGVENLYFFKGYERHVSICGTMSSSWPIIICSFKCNPKKVYKNHSNINIEARLTHAELEYILAKLAKPLAHPNWRAHNKAPFSHIGVNFILFEQLNTKFESIESLKIAYLISYLAVI